MGTPFDHALESRDLLAAAEAYALGSAAPGTPAYRAAMLQFRQRVRKVEDLRKERSGPGVLNREMVLNAAIERAMRIDGASMATAQLLDPHRQGLRLLAHRGFTSGFLEFFEDVDDTTSACGVVLADGCPVWVGDTTRSPIFLGTPSLDVMLDAGSRAVASLPVNSATGEFIGVISTHHLRPTAWTPERKLGLQRVAHSTGRLLHHLMLRKPSESS